MPFDKDFPRPGSLVVSDQLRENFLQLAIHHRGPSAPAFPQLGYLWLDTADLNNWKLRIYTKKPSESPAWVTLFEHVEGNPEYSMLHTLGGPSHLPDTLANINRKFSDFQLVKNNYTAVSNPTPDDDSTKGYAAGSYWVNITTQEVWFCIDAAEHAAVWVEGGGGGGAHVSTVDPSENDDRDHGFQTGSTWLNTVSQMVFVSVNDTPGAAIWRNVTNLSQFQYVVGPPNHTRFSSIQDALDQASSDGADSFSVLLLPGIYNEDIEIPNNISEVRLVGLSTADIRHVVADCSVVINGSVTIDSTDSEKYVQFTRLSLIAAASAFGVSGANNISLQVIGALVSAGDTLIDTTGFTGALNLEVTDYSYVLTALEACSMPAGSSVTVADSHFLSFDTNAITLAGNGCSVSVQRSTLMGTVNITGSGCICQLDTVTWLKLGPGGTDVQVDNDLATSSYFRFSYGSNLVGGGISPIVIDGASSSTLRELPYADAGDLPVYDGSRWQHKQLPVNLADFLVGASGLAKYTTIQSAIDAAVAAGHNNSNPVYIYVMPGTYTEDLTLYPGIYLYGLVPIREDIHLSNSPADISVNGRLFFDYDSADTVQYRIDFVNIKFNYTGSAGALLVLSGSSRKQIRISNCTMTHAGTVGPCIDTSRQTGFVYYDIDNSTLSITGSGNNNPIMIFGVSQDQMSARRSMFAANVSSVPAIKVTAPFCFMAIYGGPAFGANAGITGYIDIQATATSTYIIIEDICITSSTNAIVVNGTIALGYYCNVKNNLLTPNPITVGGTNASQLKEYPVSAASQDIWQRDGSRWQLRYAPRYVKTSENLASIVAAASAGSTIYLAPGTHLLSDTLVINKSITIKGDRNVTVAGPASRPVIRFDSTSSTLSSIELSGFVISVPAGGTHGIEMTGTNAITSVTLDSLGIVRSGGTGSYGIYANCSQLNGLTLRRCAIMTGFSEAVRFAVTTSLADCLIDDNYINMSSASATGISFQSGASLDRISVFNNIITAASSTGYGIYLSSSSPGTQIRINQNAIKGYQTAVYYGSSADYIQLCSNSCFGTSSSSGTGIYIGSSVDDIIVSSNTLKTYQYGIQFGGGVNSVVVSGNEIVDVQYGIWLPGGGGLGYTGTVNNNAITAASTASKTGIYVNELFRVTISNNSVRYFDDDTGSDSAGIRANSRDQTITGNLISNCYRGIQVQVGSTSATVCDSNIICDCSIGIHLRDTSFYTLSVSDNVLRNISLRFIECSFTSGTGESLCISGNNCRNKSTVDANAGILISNSAASFVSCNISHNTVNEYRGTNAAMSISNISGAVIEGNCIYDCDGDGMRLIGVTGCTINSNRIAGCLVTGKYGIVEDTACDNNLFGLNHLTGNASAHSFNGTNRSEWGNKT